MMHTWSLPAVAHTPVGRADMDQAPVRALNVGHAKSSSTFCHSSPPPKSDPNVSATVVSLQPARGTTVQSAGSDGCFALRALGFGVLRARGTQTERARRHEHGRRAH